MAAVRWTVLVFIFFATVAGSSAKPGNFESIDSFLADEVRAGRLPGAVALVVRDGAVVYLKAFGRRDPAKRAPMREDDIFRLYSMTKPIATVAALQLIEEGRLRLTDPISAYIPEFRHVRVYEPAYVPGGSDDIRQKPVAIRSTLTIMDLLRHTSGLTYGQGGPANARDYKAAGLVPEIWLKVDPLLGLTNEDVAKRIASLPLAFEPGTQWAYGRSIDVLGRVIEVASGMTLDAYLQRKIFKPLGMKDTGFNVKPAQRKRVVKPGRLQPKAVRTYLTDLSKRRRFLSAGGGLVGTAGDYARFCQMLLDDGEHQGTRLLTPQSIAMMTSDQLGRLADRPSFNLNASYTFGLGVFVRRAKDPKHFYANVGEFGWWGGGGTAFWADPGTRICGVLLTQQPDEDRFYSERFRKLVYEAITKAQE